MEGSAPDCSHGLQAKDPPEDAPVRKLKLEQHLVKGLGVRIEIAPAFFPEVTNCIYAEKE